MKRMITKSGNLPTDAAIDGFVNWSQPSDIQKPVNKALKK
jgi:hypothetical protein